MAWLTVGDTKRVAAIAEEHRALADELKQPSQQWYDAVMRSHLALFRGRFREAEDVAEDALRLGRRAITWDAECSYRLSMFALRREQGRLGEVEELVRRSVGEYPGYRLFRCLVALLECELGREDEARSSFAELAAGDFAAFPRDGEWLFCLATLAEVGTHLDERDRAETLYQLLLPYSRLNVIASGEFAIGSVGRYLGLLATIMRNPQEAERHFEAALEMNARMGALPWVARTQRDYAHMLLARDAPGDRDKAELLLSRADATFRQLGISGSESPLAARPPV